MITDLTLRWALSLVFGATAMSSVTSLLQSPDRRPAVKHALHLAMSLEMVAMAWGRGPSPAGQAVFFTLAAVWFAAPHRRRPGSRAMAGYHATMMVTMVWMPVRMGSWATTPGVGTAGMGMTGAEMTGTPNWVGAGSVLAFVFFAGAAVTWLRLGVAGNHVGASLLAGPPEARWGHELAMAGGTALFLAATL